MSNLVRIEAALLRAGAAAVATLLLAAAPAGATVFTHAASTAIDDQERSSTIEVSNPSHQLLGISVTLTDVATTSISDLAVVLKGPNNKNIPLMTGVGGANAIDNVNLTFVNDTAVLLPDMTAPTSGTYLPTDRTARVVAGAGTLCEPGPRSPFNCTLAGQFTGIADDPNDTWTLHTLSTPSGGVGSIASWSLDLTFADQTPPQTSIISGPSGPTKDNTPTFTYSSSEPGSSFLCAFDTPMLESCQPTGATSAPLSDGPHSFSVQARDEALNDDPTPATASFLVDTVAPAAVISAGPGALTNDATPTFTFSAPGDTGSAVSFECQLDGAVEFGPCSDPNASHTTEPLPDGQHTLAVHAVDAADNHSPNPAMATFTIDTVAPDTAISGGPSGTIASTATSFTFSGGDSFVCRLDGAAFAPCSGPGAVHTVAGLAGGAHHFEVAALDAAGNQDATPATLDFVVDTSPVGPPVIPIINNVILGGVHGDTLEAGLGNDRVEGFSGDDLIRGGRGMDLLLGGSGKDRVYGDQGDDELDGGSGDDLLDGGAGDDTVRGAAGKDRLLGSSGNDKLDGGAGNDRISGGSGRDTITGASGNDTITSDDGQADTVDCGSGRHDSVDADKKDKVRSNCESVRRS